MEGSKTTISRILCLVVLLASFDVTSAETQLPVRDNIEREATSFRPDLTDTFDGDNYIIPPVPETPEPNFYWVSAPVCRPLLAPFQHYRLVAIRAPPISSLIPA